MSYYRATDDYNGFFVIRNRTRSTSAIITPLDDSSEMTVKVTLNGQLLAQSDKTVVVEGNHYFPPDSIEKSQFTDSDTHTVCPWKGTASYYNTSAGGKEIKDVAWYYPHTITDKAKPVEGYIAFYKNKVEIDVQES